jgi:four helix bundle protein
MPSTTYKNGFRKLIAWQKAHMLSLLIYKYTEQFPSKENFGITNQMRRASASIGANIAEGTSRKTSKDQKHFYIMAKGSLLELDNFMELSHDLGYLNDSQYDDLLENVNKTGFILSQLINRP